MCEASVVRESILAWRSYFQRGPMLRARVGARERVGCCYTLAHVRLLTCEKGEPRLRTRTTAPTASATGRASLMCRRRRRRGVGPQAWVPCPCMYCLRAPAALPASAAAPALCVPLCVPPAPPALLPAPTRLSPCAACAPPPRRVPVPAYAGPPCGGEWVSDQLRAWVSSFETGWRVTGELSSRTHKKG